MSGPTTLGEAVAAVEAAVASLAPLLGKDSWRVGTTDLLEGLGALARVRGGVDAALLGVIREVDTRGLTGTVGSAPVATTTEGLVRDATGVSPGRARADVAAARVTGPGGVLEEFGTRLAQGRVTRAHVDVAVRCLDRIPRHLLEQDPADPDGPTATQIVTDYLLTLADTRVDDRALDRHARQLLARLAPDPTDRRDPDAPTRRFLDLTTDTTGMVTGRFALDPAAGADLRAALNAYSAPDPVSDVDGIPSRDERTPRQRRADALSRLIETARGVTTPRRGERPRIVVHTTPAQLAGVGGGLATTESGDPLPAWVLGRLACDAVLQRVVTHPTLGPLDVGREERLVTPAQRRALAGRDRGCVICGAEPDWCDAHHVIPWADGGATDLANLALLCPGHHTAVHSGTWTLDRDSDGHLIVIPPRWIDPKRTPRRPVQHLVAEAVSRIEEYLRGLVFAPDPVLQV